MAQRFDIGELQKPTRMGNGWLRVDGHLTRSGIFTYRNPDGTVRRELRPPEEVFKADSMASFSMVPVTNDHPPEVLTAANTKKYAVGTVGEVVKRDDDHVRSSILITDAETITRVETGKTALSCGYTCDVDMTSGELNGERYDAIQRNIRGNHVALVNVARAGPTARIRMDANDAEMIPNPPASSGLEKKMSLVTMRIDGIDVETTPTAKQAFEKALATATAKADGLALELSTAKADAAKQTARADGLDAELKKEQKLRADAASPEAVKALVKARVALETQGAKILGDAFKADASDRDLKIAIVEKLDGAKLDPEKAKNDLYLDARFDGAIARTPTALAKANETLNDPNAKRNDSNESPEAKARAAYLDRQTNAWQTPAKS